MAKFTSLLSFSVIFIASALTGCHNVNDNHEIFKPIEKSLAGSWELTSSSRLGDNGETLEKHGPEGSCFIYRFNSDGSLINVRTTPDGRQELRSHKWEADEDNNGYRLDNAFNSIIRLTADVLEFAKDSMLILDGDTAIMVPGKFGFKMKKIADEPSLAEKIAGKWVLSKTFEKTGDEWKEKTAASPIEAWRIFWDNGRVTGHSKEGDKVSDHEVNWLVNINTGEITMYEGEISISAKFELEDADTMVIYYNEDRDAATGKIISGEFKDICIREI